MQQLTCPKCGKTGKVGGMKSFHIPNCGPEAQAASFWAKVDKSAGPDGCWLYTGFCKWDGYGWLARDIPGRKSRYITAHRYSWILANGPVADGQQVLHQCNNAPCCNPAHLYVGTIRQNMADKVRSRRHSFGEKNSHAKLTLEQVRIIRAEWRPRSRGVKSNARELAARFGVGENTIYMAATKRTWKIDEQAPVEKFHHRPERLT